MTFQKWLTFSILAMLVLSTTHGIESSPLQMNSNSEYTGGNGTNSSTNQMLGWEWAYGAGNSNWDGGWDITTSLSGNVFITGMFRNSISFGNSCTLSPSSTMSTIFVAKFDSNGTCIWASSSTEVGNQQNEAGITGGDIAVDTNENVYVTGYFEFQIAFGNISLSPSPSCRCAFVAKLDHNGTWSWATEIRYGTGGSGSGGGEGHGVTIDSSGNVFFVGNSHKASGYDHGIIAKLNSTGMIQWQNDLYSVSGSQLNDVTLDSSGDVLVTGWFKGTLTVSIGGISESFSATDNRDMLVAKLDTDGNWIWFSKSENTISTENGYSVSTSPTGDVFVAGSFYSTWTFSSTTTLYTGGTQNGFVAKLNSTGDWQWINQVDCSCSTVATAIDVDSNGNAFVTGEYNSGTVSFGSVFLSPVGGGTDVFVYNVDANGTPQWALGGGSSGSDRGNGISIDHSGNLYLIGGYGGSTNFGTFSLGHNGNDDVFYAKLSVDYDGDTTPDVIDDDDDDDYIEDLFDDCHYSPLGFHSVGNFDHDADGCRDSDEDVDDDNDGILDVNDACAVGMTGWISNIVTDLDSDGCMDALEDLDDDADGVGDYLDLCPRDTGNSTYEFEMGCPDGDGDGRPDIRDPFPLDATEWNDADGDGTGDNSDEYPTDATQHRDSDGDGYGDDPYGNAGDACPSIGGDSTVDVLGCPDSDGDGWSDDGEPFDTDPTQWADRDGDGYGDNASGVNPDAFPSDGTQWNDTDEDEHGDNAFGTEGDWFPDDPSRWADSDRDGVADEDDAFVNDATQHHDSDGDGYGDNPSGFQPDAFPDDANEWADSDGDGLGNNGDAFPFDPTQQQDTDGDGYGDNLAGRMPDLFPENPTQWEDADEDGLGDNQSGTDADPSLNDFDNDGYNDSIDILPKFASPGDLDGDGYPDDIDAFPSYSLEWADFDNDGDGDNIDPDDDNDGWGDWVEMREGTDPHDFFDKPVETWEMVIPGTTIGLGAWDMIGIFGGVPLFGWLAFGFVTRNKRAGRFEAELKEAQTKDELDSIAIRSEFALMLRLLGPHQGIRLERLRAELDDALAGEIHHVPEVLEPEDITEDQTHIVEDDMAMMQTEPTADATGNVQDGYDWVKDDGQDD